MNVEFIDTLPLTDDYISEVFLNEFGYDAIRTIEFQRLRYIDTPLFLDYITSGPKYNMMFRSLYVYGLYNKIKKIASKKFYRDFYQKIGDLLLIYQVGRNCLPFIGNDIYYELLNIDSKIPDYKTIRDLFLRGEIGVDRKGGSYIASDYIPKELLQKRNLHVEDLWEYYTGISGVQERVGSHNYLYEVMRDWYGNDEEIYRYLRDVVEFVYSKDKIKVKYPDLYEVIFGKGLFGIHNIADMRITLGYMESSMRGVSIVENYILDDGHFNLLIDDKRLVEKINLYFIDLEKVWSLWSNPVRIYFLLRLKELIMNYFVSEDKNKIISNKEDYLAMFFLGTSDFINYLIKKSEEKCNEGGGKYCDIMGGLVELKYRERDKTIAAVSDYDDSLTEDVMIGSLNDTINIINGICSSTKEFEESGQYLNDLLGRIREEIHTTKVQVGYSRDKIGEVSEFLTDVENKLINPIKDECVKNQDEYVINDLSTKYFKHYKNYTIYDYLKEEDVIRRIINTDAYKDSLRKKKNVVYPKNLLYVRNEFLTRSIRKRKVRKSITDIIRIAYIYKLFKNYNIYSISQHYPRFYRINPQKWFLATWVYLINKDSSSNLKKTEMILILNALLPNLIILLLQPNTLRGIKKLDDLLTVQMKDPRIKKIKRAIREIINKGFNVKELISIRKKIVEEVLLNKNKFGEFFMVFGWEKEGNAKRALMPPNYIHTFKGDEETNIQNDALKSPLVSIMLAIVMYILYELEKQKRTNQK